MPSKTHEQIVDDIRDIVVSEYEYKPVWVVVDAFAAARFMNKNQSGTKGLAPDLAIVIDDEFAAIAVEIGDMEIGKWDHTIVPQDQRAVRVIRVTFERGVSIIHSRHTKEENALVALLVNRLPEME